MKRVMIACEYVWQVACIIFLGCSMVILTNVALLYGFGCSILDYAAQPDSLIVWLVMIAMELVTLIVLPDLAWRLYAKSWTAANQAFFRTHGYGLGRARSQILWPICLMYILAVLQENYQFVPGYTQIVWATGILCGLVLMILVGYAVITKIGHSRGWIEYVKPKTFAVYTVTADENGSPAMQHMEEHIATPEDTIFR